MEGKENKIIRKPLEVSTRELEGLKDFKAILNMHQRAVNARQKRYKGSLWIVAVLAVAFSIYQGYKIAQFESDVKKEKNSIEAKTSNDTNAGLELVDSEESESGEINLEQAEEAIPKIKQPPAKQNSGRPLPKIADREEETEGNQVEAIENEPLQAINKHIQARPVMGFQKLHEFLENDLVYPDIQLTDSIEGIVTISFIVDTTGAITNIEVMQSLGSKFDLEAIRAVQNMPPWRPATFNGRPIQSKLSIPLRFNIEK